MRNYFLFNGELVFLLLLTFTSCTREEVPVKTIFKASDFPISIGNYWEYERLDNLKLRTDTIIAKVLEADLSKGEMRKLWLLEWKTSTGSVLDTNYISYNTDSLTYYKYNSALDQLEIQSKYIFPFQEHSEWTLDFAGGTYTVEKKDFNSEDYNLPYGKSYLLKRFGVAPGNYRVDETILIASGIGIIYQNSYEFDGIPITNEVLKLIDYKTD